MKYDQYLDEIVHMRPLEALEILAGSSLLDIGCGSGEIVTLLRKDKIRSIGIDISPWESNEYVIRADAQMMPFGQRVFDYVISFLVIGHLGNEGKAMEEISRVTKPGSRVMFVHFASSCLNIKVPVWKFLGRPLQHYGIYKLYTVKETTRVLNKFGFDVIKIYVTDFVPPMINFLPSSIQSGVYKFFAGADYKIARIFRESGKKIVVIAEKRGKT